MAYFWVQNILCEVQDGKVHLRAEDRSSMHCSGKCHACENFLGVDLGDTGKPYFRSCCSQRQDGSAVSP